MFNRVLVPVLLLAAPCAWPAAIVFSGAGANATTERDEFRTAVGGGTVAGAGGLFGGVRREINWDGVGAGASAPNLMPANQFQARGNIYATPGTGFQVSANAGVAPIQFDNIDPSYSSLFEPFSTQKLFTAIGSNIVDVNFTIPGTTTPATTSAFGSIFSDVDLANTTSIEFFDENGTSLGLFYAPAAAGNETFSFLGVVFTDERVARARLTSGNAALAAGVTEAGGVDLVAMDDFLYAEPAAVPEPATLMLTGSALVAVYALRRRRQ
jgi:hypothetical protein